LIDLGEGIAMSVVIVEEKVFGTKEYLSVY
jgi:hypothetical protein